MTQFSNCVQRRGRQVAAGQGELLGEYQTRLDRAIDERWGKIRRGESRPVNLSSIGARDLLERLTRRGLVLVILSGTFEHRVKTRGGLAGPGAIFWRPYYGSHPDRKIYETRRH